MKDGYFRRAEVKIQLKEGLIIQKYSSLIIAKAKVTRLIGNDKVLFFRDCKGTEKTQVKVFPVRTLGYSLASTSPLEKRLEKWFRTYNSL